jgi:hypothetical protein
MQISRHWRLNSQRYRLEGFRNSNGEVSLQARPTLNTEPTHTDEPVTMANKEAVATSAA